MKTLLKTFVALFAFAVSVHAADLVNHSGASKIAINGYDPVAFFTKKAPTHGNPSISHKYQDVVYLFSSEETKQAFVKNPSKYAPQCGGFCAYGASVGALFPVDVNTWDVIDGKLYFNLNPEIQKLFRQDQANNVKKAQQNWPTLVKKHS